MLQASVMFRHMLGEGGRRIGEKRGGRGPHNAKSPAGWILMSEHRILPKHYCGFLEGKLIRGSERG